MEQTGHPLRQTQEAEVARLGPWFHNLHLPGGTQTAPNHFLGDFPMFKWRRIAPRLPENLEGWSVLDVGCNAGFYSIELAKRGARVLGIDSSEHYLRQARWASEQFGVQDRVRYRRMQVYDLCELEESFDLVWFMGVFYHLRYPLLGLDMVTEKVKRLLVFQTMTMPGPDRSPDTRGGTLEDRQRLLDPGWPKMAFLEHEFQNDPTNWWAANLTGVAAMLRSSGMRIAEQVGEEVLICEPDPDHPAAARGWNREEYLSACGLSRRLR